MTGAHVGTNDVVPGTTAARSRLNLANVIDEATTTGIATFVVGVPPTPDPECNRGSRCWSRLRQTCAHGAASRTSTATAPLADHDQWRAELSGAARPDPPGSGGLRSDRVAGAARRLDRWLHLSS